MTAMVELHHGIEPVKAFGGLDFAITQQKILHAPPLLSYPVIMSEQIPPAALITGAARRVGRTIALRLAGQGFMIGIHYHRSEADARNLAEEITRIGGKSALLQADLSNEAETQALFPAAHKALGPIGILINNASTFDRDEWFDATRQNWDHHMDPNLRAPFILTQAFATHLPENAHGLIINLADQRVWSLTPHFMTYTISKAALWTLTQTMALALAPRIRVNAIGPGPTLPSPRQTDEQFAKQAASVPLRHSTTPDEIADAVMAFLQLRSVTGQMLALDGGQHLQWSPTRSLLPPEE